MNNQLNNQRFPHELQWYDYIVCTASKGSTKVGICHKGLQPCTIYYYSREKLEQLARDHRWNPFLLPVYQEALRHFS
jgi:hypothetical protein